jgi:excisionase family DNA binding protein
VKPPPQVSIELPPALVDKNEAARLLAVSPRHVDALAARGLLPKVKLGSACRFRVSDIMGMVDRLASGQVISKEDG